MKNKQNILILISVLIFSGSGNLFAQDSTFVLSKSMFNKNGILQFPDLKEWHFKVGNDSSWANPNLDDSQWEKLDSSKIANFKVDENGLFEGWFRIRLKLDSSLKDIPIYLNQYYSTATDIYFNGKLIHSFGHTNFNRQYRTHNPNIDLPYNISPNFDEEILMAVHFVEFQEPLYKLRNRKVLGYKSFLSIVNTKKLNEIRNQTVTSSSFFATTISILCLLVLLFWLLVFLNKSQNHLIYIAITVTFILSIPGLNYINWFVLSSSKSNLASILMFLSIYRVAGIFFSLPILIATIITNHIPKPLKIYLWLGIIITIIASIAPGYSRPVQIILPIISAIFCLYYPISERKKLKGAKWIVVFGLVLTAVVMISFAVLFNWLQVKGINEYRLYFLLTMFLTFPLSLLIYIAFWLKEMITDVEKKAKEVIKITEEKRLILESQNIKLENQVKDRTKELSQSLENLKAAQSQLIQSEKMASLGELTAGIAHEIQNPLNFVNNFSEVSKELVVEMKEEIANKNFEEVEEISEDIDNNLEKINHHGKRAEAIVKGMLQHSRTSAGEKEPTDINKLADEYLRLSYHGLRAKDKSFNADFKTEFDESLPKINIVPQDIGRVLLNLINNAFYAVDKKAKGVIPLPPTGGEKKSQTEYRPIVTISTTSSKSPSGDLGVKITVKDNGPGIPPEIKDKIFQPFFTTKPTGSGTGLGLSLSYDIVKAHGGTISVDSNANSGTEFFITLPIKL